MESLQELQQRSLSGSSKRTRSSDIFDDASITGSTVLSSYLVSDYGYYDKFLLDKEVVSFEGLQGRYSSGYLWSSLILLMCLAFPFGSHAALTKLMWVAKQHRGAPITSTQVQYFVANTERLWRQAALVCCFPAGVILDFTNPRFTGIYVFRMCCQLFRSLCIEFHLVYLRFRERGVVFRHNISWAGDFIDLGICSTCPVIFSLSIMLRLHFILWMLLFVSTDQLCMGVFAAAVWRYDSCIYIFNVLHISIDCDDYTLYSNEIPCWL